MCMCCGIVDDLFPKPVLTFIRISQVKLENQYIDPIVYHHFISSIHKTSCLKRVHHCKLISLDKYVDISKSVYDYLWRGRLFYLFTVRLSLYESVSALMQAFALLTCIVRVVEFKRTRFLVLLPSTASPCTVSIQCEYTFFVRKYVRRHYWYVHWLSVYVFIVQSFFVRRLYWLIWMSVLI